MSAALKNRWLKWGSVLVLAAIILGAVYSYEALYVAKVKAAYAIANSARFISANTDYLNKTFTTPTNNKIWTFSAWIKRGDFYNGSNNRYVLDANTSSGDGIVFNSTESLWLFQGNGSNTSLITNAVFRDPAAWYHIVVAEDTTQATAANRVSIYVNGVQITSFSTATYPAQNYAGNINSAVAHAIGNLTSSAGSGNDFGGYIADAYFVDGQALPPTAFGATDANGYWRPIAYAGTYGTNGFHLNFSNGSSLGTDSSGQGNNFTVNGLTSTDQVLDTPTNSYATLNPVDKGSNNTPSAGNLTYQISASTQGIIRSTFMLPTTGKWYWEATRISYGNMDVGVATKDAAFGNYLGQDQYGWGYDGTSGGVFNNNAALASYATYTTGDVIGMAFDASAGTLAFYKNNSLQGTITGLTSAGSYFPAAGSFSGGGTLNFGQGGQSGLTFDSASGGYFKYTPPSGYKALSTTNLPTPTIAVPKNYFDARTYVGTGAAQSVVPLTYTTTTFTSSGTWTAPAGVTSVTVSALGGGGGGGANYWSGGGTSGDGGSAGTLTTSVVSVTPSTGYTVTIGAGGGGAGPGGASGSSGGSSSFGALVTSAGGVGGAGSTSGHQTGAGAAGANAPGGYGTGGSGGGSNGSPEATSGTGNGAGGGGAGNGGTGSSGYNGAYYYAGGSGSGGLVTVTYSTASATFQPDIVWIKDRTTTNAHGIFDSVRGATKYWSSNSTAAETIDAQSLTAFLANGFTLGTQALFNSSGDNYVAWEWKRCPTALFTASCAAADGVDIVTYTGNGTNGTHIAHSLGVAPALIITKNRDGINATNANNDGNVWSPYLANATEQLWLMSNSGQNANGWGSGNPNASYFVPAATNYDNVSGHTYVAYLFAPVAGFSAFGSYTGNGSADGPFVFTNFKPRYVMVKRTDTTGDWYVWDTARDTYNPTPSYLLPDTTAADSSATNDMDILSNGFKLRVTTAAINASGGTYIYAAFADVPFKYSAGVAPTVFVQATAFLLGMTF